MAIIERSGLYEVLVRYDNGAFKGAHRIDLHEVVREAEGDTPEEVLSSKTGEAQPLTAAEARALIPG